MKTLNKYMVLVSICLSMGISSTCLAIMIDDTNAGTLDGTFVGSLDNLINQADKAGSVAAELAWVNSILDPDVTFTIKSANVDYYLTDRAGDTTYAFELLTKPGHYLIKNGGRMALYENKAELDWSVFDASLLVDSTKKWNIPSDSFQISHVAEYDGNPDYNVPAPAVLGVMAMGLLGVGFGTRRKLT